MTSLVSNQTHVGCLVATVVLGRSARPFQQEVERLLRTNGPEWLVTRQKAIWTAANHLRNGDREAARSLYRENSISYHKGDMTPKGPYRPVVRGYVQASRPSVIRRYAAVLRFYTSLVLPELSKKQSTKSRLAITSPLSGKVPADLSRFVEEVGELLRSKYPPISPEPVSLQRLSPNTYQYSRHKLAKEDRGVPLRSMAMSLISEGYIPPSLVDTDSSEELTSLVPRNKFMGKIFPIQEQGAKARVVAMPSTRIQAAFYPLHVHLNQVDRAFPSSCMMDQQKGVFGVMEHMRDKPAYATDLSSATDRFPRSLSIVLLDSLGLSKWADAIDEVSSGDWESPWGPVSYSVGQPMGLYGSFPLFHLSNQVVASYAMHKVAGVESPVREPLLSRFDELAANIGRPEYQPLVRFPSGTCFYVVGDDIVFSDRRVEEEYRSLMAEMGVGISDSKSFSGKLTEFAGFVMTEARGEPFAFRPYKPPVGQQVSNPVDFLAALGTKARVISPYWDRQVKLFSQTWSDRSPDLSPWVTMDRDPVQSHWDLTALNNEMILLSEKYPSVARNIIAVVSQDFSWDQPAPMFFQSTVETVPWYQLETNRERLGETPKHPLRRRNPLRSDPLMEALRMKEAVSQKEEDSPQVDSSPPGPLQGLEDKLAERKRRFPELFVEDTTELVEDDEYTPG